MLIISQSGQYMLLSPVSCIYSPPSKHKLIFCTMMGPRCRSSWHSFLGRTFSFPVHMVPWVDIVMHSVLGTFVNYAVAMSILKHERDVLLSANGSKVFSGVHFLSFESQAIRCVINTGVLILIRIWSTFDFLNLVVHTVGGSLHNACSCLESRMWVQHEEWDGEKEWDGENCWFPHL